MKNIEKKVNLISVRVDFRTELLGIIQVLSENPLTKTNEKIGNQKYLDEIKKRFGKYKNHPVIKKAFYYREKYGFNYDASVTLFLELDEHFKAYNLTDYILKNRLDNDLSIYQFIDELEDFAKEIGFEKYYMNNQRQYESYINQFVTPLENYDVIGYLKDYYNISIDNKTFVINVLPFQASSGYGSFVGDVIYSSIGARIKRRDDSDITFVNPKNEYGVISSILHEFSHSIVNPLTDKLNIISEDDNLFDEIKDIMRKHAYFTNSTIMNEHIIRAVQVRHRYKYYQDDIEDYIKDLEESGFIFIRIIVKSLEEYENNRDIYPTFESFYPNIIKNMKLKKLKKQTIVINNN